MLATSQKHKTPKTRTNINALEKILVDLFSSLHKKLYHWGAYAFLRYRHNLFHIIYNQYNICKKIKEN